jgi:glycosyltransferase involved in cell wall biosynthesis
MLKITVATASISRLAGGTFTSIRRLHQSINDLKKAQITVFGLQDEFSEQDSALWHPLSLKTFPKLVEHQFGYSPCLRRAILNSESDIVHTHGIWMYPSVAVSHWHCKTGSPYLISLHGMLDPWALKNSGWKKRLALVLYERKHLENAACIRALCDSEAEAIRAFGLKNPICIIPNGIDLPQIQNQKTEMENKFQLSAFPISTFATGRKTLLYLGRIHPKKGLVNLLRAWAAVNRKSEIGNRKSEEWQLAIAGWDQGGHEAELKRLCDELGLKWADLREHKDANSISAFSFQRFSIFFLGPQFNEAKAACYRDCDAFVLPSFSEGLPMVVLEAWAHGKPVLMTPECNLPEGFAANAALRIETSAESIAQGLQDLFRLPASDLRSLGGNGHKLVASRFVWPKIAGEMSSVYEWLLGGGLKPECVQTSARR